jgi:hypothetical protein
MQLVVQYSLAWQIHQWKTSSKVLILIYSFMVYIVKKKQTKRFVGLYNQVYTKEWVTYNLLLFSSSPSSSSSSPTKLKYIHHIVMRNTKSRGDIVRTKRACTLLNQYPYRHVQVILRFELNLLEVNRANYIEGI